jgi:hypothetical protein
MSLSLLAPVKCVNNVGFAREKEEGWIWLYMRKTWSLGVLLSGEKVYVLS